MRTVTDVAVLVLRAEAFETWLQSRPDLGRRLLQLLARKVVARDPEG
jgi:CRP-like cAMP-binding protein